MAKQITVLGAGMVGVSIAWHLQKQGYAVTLIDRKVPGEETSYGNAGLIQREAVFPYPFPKKLQEIWRILPNQSLDIRYRPAAMWHYKRALSQYWYHSDAERFNPIAKSWATLIAHCTDAHEEMFTAANAQHLVRKVGWLQLHRHEESFQAALHHAQNATEQGVTSQILSPKDIAQLEPNLNVSEYVGGIHWLNAWQVTSPGDLVKAYAKAFEALGGVVEKHNIRHIQQQSGSWQLQTDTEVLHAPALIVAAGPWSTKILKPLGYDFPLFPIRGYHKHYTMPENAVLNHSMVDEDFGFVLGPKSAGIRLTTGAEFTFLGAKRREEQLQAVEKIARQLLPLDQAIETQAWFGHRPCLPDMKPIIGSAPKHENLWLAFGHAHQGFTLGPITGKVLSQLIANETPMVDLEPFHAERFIKA